MTDVRDLFEEFMTAFYRKPISGFEQVSNPKEMLTNMLESAIYEEVVPTRKIIIFAP